MIQYLFLVLFFLFSILHLISSWKDDAQNRKKTKPFLLILLLLYYLSAAHHKDIFLILALLTSWLGDVLLIPKGHHWFAAGGISFLLSHVFFALVYVKRITLSSVSLVLIILAAAVYFTVSFLIMRAVKDNTPKKMGEADWKYGVFPDYQSMVAGFSFMASDWDTYVAGAVPSFFGEGAEPDREEFDWVMSRFSDNDPGIILTMFVNNSTFDTRGGLPRINVPVLLTHGTLPSYCTKEIMEGIAGMMVNSRVEEFYGGHLHMIQDSAHFNNVLVDFLR